jgi:large subunit ribosomal protein L24
LPDHGGPQPERGAGMKIKKGDTVVVIAGKDKGAKGKVIAAFPRRDKVLVEGVNRMKKHEKIRTTQRGSKTGGIVTQEAPIHISNVQLVDSEGKPTRIGFRRDENGQKVRIARSTGKDL